MSYVFPDMCIMVSREDTGFIYVYQIDEFYKIFHDETKQFKWHIWTHNGWDKIKGVNKKDISTTSTENINQCKSINNNQNLLICHEDAKLVLLDETIIKRTTIFNIFGEYLLGDLINMILEYIYPFTICAHECNEDIQLLETKLPIYGLKTHKFKLSNLKYNNSAEHIPFFDNCNMCTWCSKYFEPNVDVYKYTISEKTTDLAEIQQIFCCYECHLEKQEHCKKSGNFKDIINVSQIKYCTQSDFINCNLSKENLEVMKHEFQRLDYRCDEYNISYNSSDSIENIHTNNLGVTFCSEYTEAQNVLLFGNRLYNKHLYLTFSTYPYRYTKCGVNIGCTPELHRYFMTHNGKRKVPEIEIINSYKDRFTNKMKIRKFTNEYEGYACVPDAHIQYKMPFSIYNIVTKSGYWQCGLGAFELYG